MKNMFALVILVVALASPALSVCPKDWAGYGTDCYVNSTFTANWRDAQAHCATKAPGAALASIHSLDEQHFIYNYMGARDAWIGLNDLSNENTFVWSDGSPVTYTYWLSGQPNNLLDQDCVNVSPDSSTGEWDDNHCVEHKNFICKVKGT